MKQIQVTITLILSIIVILLCCSTEGKKNKVAKTNKKFRKIISAWERAPAMRQNPSNKWRHPSSSSSSLSTSTSSTLSRTVLSKSSRNDSISTRSRDSESKSKRIESSKYGKVKRYRLLKKDVRAKNAILSRRNKSKTSKVSKTPKSSKSPKSSKPLKSDDLPKRPSNLGPSKLSKRTRRKLFEQIINIIHFLSRF